MRKVIIVKYGEIAMRGKNRYLVENRLIKTIIKNIRCFENLYVRKEQGRIIIENPDGDVNYDNVIPKIETILGIVAICPGVMVENQSIENLRKVALQQFNFHYPKGNVSFKVVSKRSDKRYPMTSKEIAADIGGYILNNCSNITVDVHNPDVKLVVELRTFAYIYTDLIKTFGGLPVGASGKATVLLSGGIDSPVAAFMTAKRGVEIEAVYFDSPPYTSARAKQKVVDLAKRLSDFTGSIKLYIVPFTEIQLYLYDNIPPEKLTILLKRCMLKVADRLSYKTGSLAVVMGDSIGQVASQTLHSINAINSAATLPVIRPLAGLDKQEIVDIAKKIGTYEISIRPYEDCCTIFVAKHPETKPKKSLIEKWESRLENLDDMINRAIDEMQTIEI